MEVGRPATQPCFPTAYPARSGRLPAGWEVLFRRGSVVPSRAEPCRADRTRHREKNGIIADIEPQYKEKVKRKIKHDEKHHLCHADEK